MHREEVGSKAFGGHCLKPFLFEHTALSQGQKSNWRNIPASFTTVMHFLMLPSKLIKSKTLNLKSSKWFLYYSFQHQKKVHRLMSSNQEAKLDNDIK